MPLFRKERREGPVLAVDALRYSLNIPSVQMQYLVGAQTTAEFADVLRKTRFRDDADVIARSRGVVEQSSFDFLNGGTYFKVVLEGIHGSKVYHFVRKGDRRMEALATLKLSSVHHYLGDADTAGRMAAEGLRLVPDDAFAIRLRLEGNLAITHTWLTEHLSAVATACRRIAVEATTRGLEHFAAIALHNLGTVQRYAGQLDEAEINLQRAASFWASLPPNPFQDNLDLVATLLASDQVRRAEEMAITAMDRTRRWPRAHADAIHGRALIYAHQGRFSDAIQLLAPLIAAPRVLGTSSQLVGASYIDCLILSGATPSELANALRAIEAGPYDPRHEILMAPARALVAHAQGDCDGSCLGCMEAIQKWDERGATMPATTSKLSSSPITIGSSI